MTNKGFQELACNFFAENGELSNEEDILNQFTKANHLQLETYYFNLNMIDIRQAGNLHQVFCRVS